MRASDWAELERAIGEIHAVARGFGLDPLPIHFELVPATVMYEVSAYGLPGRFSHWTAGKAYQIMKTRYDLGLSRIYELVINADPAQAFLLENNTILANKLVVAHVFAHADFFKHNAYFRAVPRDMADRANLHAERIRAYEFAHGRREVEEFLDAVLAIQDHVDPEEGERPDGRVSGEPRGPRRRPDDYADLFPGQSPEEAGSDEAAARRECHDLLWFLLREAPHLEEWQRDIIAMVRDERLYFAPQIRTKIINEGWAAYWHTRIMHELALGDGEYTEFARLNAEIQAPYQGALNPYLVGRRIFEDIERRWGAEGRARIFEVREVEDDVSFLRNHLTRELLEELDLYVYQYSGDAWRVADKDWEAVREAVVRSRVGGGVPVIVVADGDYRGNRELYLKHKHDGRDLDLEYAQRTLAYVQRLWGRRVHLETIVDGQRRVLISDGDTCVKS